MGRNVIFQDYARQVANVPAGNLPPSADGYRDRSYYTKFEFRGKTYLRCLETTDATEAQRRARLKHREITSAVVAGEYDRIDATKLRQRSTLTLGEILPLYRQHARVKPRTASNNIGALDLVLRRALDDDHLDTARVPLTTLTRKLVRDYQDAAVRAAGPDLLARGRAITSANSFVRQARSLFAKHAQNDLLAYYQDAGLKLPENIEAFRTASLLKEPSHKFKPAAAETMARLLAALPALKLADPDAYRICLLSYGCGLRRGEIVHLRGSDVRHDADRHTIHLVRRAEWTTKTDEERLVPMESHVWAELVALDPMLAAPRSSDPVAPLADYILTGRTAGARLEHFRRFGAWLSGLGWTSAKKAHQLRKEWETLAVRQLGSTIAAALAGHSVEVQQKHYFGLSADSLPAVKIFG